MFFNPFLFSNWQIEQMNGPSTLCNVYQNRQKAVSDGMI
jgi:hypothetical protein